MNTTVIAGQHFSFPLRNDPATPELWRALDATVARWVLSHGGSALLARVAGWASFADGQGDSVLALSGERAGLRGLPALDGEALAALRAQPMVADVGPDQVAGEVLVDAPFVLAGAAFYLRRNYLQEVAVAAKLRQRRTPLAVRAAITADDLRALFNGGHAPAEAMQREAVQRAPGQRLMVLTGGPGTGKTTTVLRMVLALSRDHAARHPGQAPVVRMAAPTGKAAQRLADALAAGAARLRSGDKTALPDAWHVHLDAALARPPCTLHRLLGSRGRQGSFRHGRDNPLPADIVVVDEASMIDLALLRVLLDALSDDAALLLVGDADQLTSVATGSVLIDIVQAMQQRRDRALLRLDHCFRSDAVLVPVNTAVRDGDWAAFQQAWQAAGSTGRAMRYPLHDRADLGIRLGIWARQWRAALDQAGAFGALQRVDRAALRRCLAVLHQQQLLCALREGEFGALQANQVIEASLRRSLPGSGEHRWYPGRVLMVTRNDPASGLFNGDVGLCLLLAHGDGDPVLQVAFECGNDGSDIRLFDPDDLPDCEGAFALTVHKSQGSEYQQVAVLLPPDENHPLLSRQLLYTALSRAQIQLHLWSTEPALQACVNRPVSRQGRLTERLLHGDA